MPKVRNKGKVKRDTEGNAQVLDAKTETLLEERYTITEYIIVNVIFWAFCIIQALLISLITKESFRECRGIVFFFGSLMIGFTVVSIFSWLHDIFYKETDDGVAVADYQQRD